VKRLSFFLIIALFAGMSTAGVKYVAVVETDVDAQSGVSAQLNPAEVREITAELRRQATENLPTGKYSVMTSETVQSMGGSVLEECAEENCVVALGSKIGADYIVRGTVSKFQTKFTLAIELYETENGTLVLSSEAVRSENLEELLGMASKASANMFRKFAGEKESARKSKAGVGGGRDGDKAITYNKRESGYYFAPKYQVPVGTPVSWGGVNLEGGWTWGNGVFLGIDFSGGGEWVTDSTGYVLMGLGISLGNVYDLGGQLQLVYGGSVGLWLTAVAYPYTYKGYDDATYVAPSYLAPFVKLRWNFIELTYRGLLGHKVIEYNKTIEVKYQDVYDYDRDEYYPEKYEEYNKEKDITDFGWNNHQLMLGFYFPQNRGEGRKYDYYLAPKYQISFAVPRSYYGINLEGGVIWRNGIFFGVDFGADGGTHLLSGGIGLSLGNIYDLGEELQLVYGGSVGIWGVDGRIYDDDYIDYIGDHSETDYFGPFVKLRWKSVELMYRGLLGYKEVKFWGGGKKDITGFGWNNHQLMLGFYNATSKRAR